VVEGKELVREFAGTLVKSELVYAILSAAGGADGSNGYGA